MLLLVLIFIVIFVLVVFAAGVGFNYWEAQRKKKVKEMLRTAAGPAVISDAKVLLEDPEENGDSIGKLISQLSFSARLERKIQQAGLDWTVANVCGITGLLTVVGAIAGLRFPLWVPGASSVIGAVVLGSLPHLYLSRRRSKRLDQFEEQLPEALDFLGRAMRAGHAFSISLEMLSDESPAPLGLEFRKVFNEQNLGLPIETALKNLAERIPLLDVRFFVSAVLLQRETGGNLAEILSKLAHVIRERFKLKGQVKAASAHGRITGGILTAMPVVLMLGLLVVAPGYLQGMANDPDGRYLIAGSVIGILLGHFTIRKIIDIKV